jgi:hypothetical protein
MSSITSDSAAVPVAARQLALERLFEVAAVEDLGEPVDGGEPVDLVVVGGLDVPAGDELEDGAPDLHQVAVAHHELAGDGLVVDVAAIGRAEVFDGDLAVAIDQLGVVAADRFLVDLDVGLR